MIYLMMGQIGSGKSVQSTQLAEQIGAIQLGMGQLLRDHYAENPALSSGKLLEHDLVTDAVDAFLNSRADETIIIDGFPRNLDQQVWLDEHIQSHPDHAIKKVFVLNVDDPVIDERLLKRGRADDTPEAITARKKVFENEVAPVIEVYRGRGLTTDIDGNQSMDLVNEQLRAAISEVA